MTDEPLIFATTHGEAHDVRASAYGSEGTLLKSDEIEVVWIRKEGEEIEPGWFEQETTDVIVVVEGGLRVEFEAASAEDRVLGVGDVLILPPRTRCRAFRWPRTQASPTTFVAVYRPPARTPPGGREAASDRPST
jgi:hypothetical protein